MTQLLDNIVWHALTGPHVRFAVGRGGARRYAAGFSPILGFADQANPDFAALRDHCEPRVHFYTDGWSGPAPEGWRIEMESTMFKMVWHGELPERDEAPDAVSLGPEHAEQALELATLTNPGPFGLRTIELGEYFGYFDGPRLIAMAGERFAAATWREVSGVCTHPDYQGRGCARRLMMKLVRRELLRGQIPFLHVLRDNTTARVLYAKLGFREYCESVVRVVSRPE